MAIYIVDEPIEIDKDIYAHPRSTMAKGLELLTKRNLKVKKIADIDCQTKSIKNYSAKSKNCYMYCTIKHPLVSRSN